METWISYGGGVQTFGMLVMAKNGDLPFQIDGCIFSDTMAEFPETYEHIETHAKTICEEMGIPFVKVCLEPGIIEGYKEKNALPLPGFRSCTGNYKVRPIKTFFRERFANEIKNNRGEAVVRCLIGISTDEASRVVPREQQKPKYMENLFPFIDLDMSRKDIITYIEESGYPVPRKSGCFMCPYGNLKGFVNLRVGYPDLFQIAVEMEERYFKARPERRSGFLSHSQIKLKELGQMPSLFSFADQIPDDSEECKSGSSCFL